MFGYCAWKSSRTCCRIGASTAPALQPWSVRSPETAEASNPVPALELALAPGLPPLAAGLLAPGAWLAVVAPGDAVPPPPPLHATTRREAIMTMADDVRRIGPPPRARRPERVAGADQGSGLAEGPRRARGGRGAARWATRRALDHRKPSVTDRRRSVAAALQSRCGTVNTARRPPGT